MVRWQRSIEIEAAPARVWNVIADVGHWPEWTPSILSVEDLSEPFALGGTATVQALGTPTSGYRVTRWEPGHGFDWETRVRGATAIGRHWVEPAGEGKSLATLTLDMPGIIAVVFKPMLSRVIKRNLEMEANGLKQRSESQA
jgi:carbon monoxide dehydrogenase subunit G